MVESSTLHLHVREEEGARYDGAFNSSAHHDPCSIMILGTSDHIIDWSAKSRVTVQVEHQS